MGRCRDRPDRRRWNASHSQTSSDHRRSVVAARVGVVLGDVDVVVHLISRTHHVGEGSEAYDAYYRDNVGVSDALMEATASTATAKVVYLSSIKAIAESTSGAAIDSNTVPAPTSVYGTTKLEAEEHFTQWAKENSEESRRSPPAVGLRPVGEGELPLAPPCRRLAGTAPTRKHREPPQHDLPGEPQRGHPRCGVPEHPRYSPSGSRRP